MHQLTRIGIFVFLIGTVHIIHGQENAQTRIPASLEECYQNSEIFERDNRLPMTINTFIDLIRKIEDSPSFNQDIRQLAVSLIHRFKLDGIERATGVLNTRKVIPFSPIGYQFSKHRLLLSRLVPGNAITFENDTLSIVERCSLHFMLSSSIENQVRGDESFRCNQLAQLRVNRVPRDIEQLIRPRRSDSAKKNNFLGDVELLEELEEHNRRQRKFKKHGNYQMEESADDGGENEEDEDEDDEQNKDSHEIGNDEQLPQLSPRNNNNLVEVSPNLLSPCPVQNGVIRTMWGSLSAGALISGIAAGLQQQTIATRDLLALSRVKNDQYKARQTQQGLTVDNRWAATLAGDLAEVALLQAPGAAEVTVGASGGWNQTSIPKWYFLMKREHLEMTDAEIRGGLDGLILAKNIVDYRNRATQMRLSQLLDMYYSTRGVFSSNVKACERRTHFTGVASIEEMTTQTTAFSLVLDREMQLKVTLTSEAIAQFSSDAAQALSTYVPSALDDLSCQATAIIPSDPTIWRTSTDIYIYVDTTWPFVEIQPVLFYLLENLDINKYASSYTILNANTADILVNTTSSTLDFNALFNRTHYQNHVSGLNLARIFDNIRAQGKILLNQEQRSGSTGGRSHISLIIPQTASVGEAESTVAFERLQILRDEFPDSNLIFLTGGIESRFERFVRQPRRDLFTLRISSNVNENIGSTLNYVVQRIQQVPRRIINPRCGSVWWTDQLGSTKMYQYVERGSVNFYRVAPNYFFLTAENRRVRIEGQRYGLISVCSSRYEENPRANMSNSGQNDVNCIRIDGDQSFEYNLQNACPDSWLIQNCPPLYISVEAPPITGEETNYRCMDKECRFPDSIRYLVHAENFGCFSSGDRLFGVVSVVLVLVFVVLKI